MELSLYYVQLEGKLHVIQRSSMCNVQELDYSSYYEEINSL